MFYKHHSSFRNIFCCTESIKRVTCHKNMSPVMRKNNFCIWENIATDQLCSNCTADQRLCFRYRYSTIPLLPKSEISSLKPSSVVVQPGLCRTWSETPKTCFLASRLISPWGFQPSFTTTGVFCKQDSLFPVLEKRKEKEQERLLREKERLQREEQLRIKRDYRTQQIMEVGTYFFLNSLSTSVVC